MAYNGSGTFNRLYNWVTDKANGIKITASRMDAEFDGIATGLSNAITRDGQSPPTANIPMGGYKFTGLGTASADGDALSRGAGDARYLQLDGDNAYIDAEEWQIKTGGTTRAGVGINGFASSTFVVSPDGTNTRFAISDTSAQLHHDNIVLGKQVTSTVTISNASPAVVTWAGHGLDAGAVVAFSTTGSLPTGISAATTYYVLSTGLGDDSFRISATLEGTAINTSSAGSGTHTAKAIDFPPGITWKIPDYNAQNSGSDHPLFSVGFSTAASENQILSGYVASTQYPLAVYTRDSVNTETIRLFIEGGDNTSIGIGTKTPTSLSQGSFMHIHSPAGGSNDAAWLHFTNAATGATQSDGGYVGITSDENLIIQCRTPNSLILQTTDASAHILFATNAGSAGRISASGNWGFGADFASSYTLGMYGNIAREIGVERHPTSNTAGSALTIYAGGAAAGSTNKGGGNLNLVSGVSTGTGYSTINFLGYSVGSSGTSDNTQETWLTLGGTSATRVSIYGSGSSTGLTSMYQYYSNTGTGVTYASRWSTQDAGSSSTRSLFYAAGQRLGSGGTVTISDGGGVSAGTVTLNSHGLGPGDVVTFSTTGSLPAGISAATTYYVSTANVTTNTLEVSTSLANALAGTSVVTSSAGSGTHTLAVTTTNLQGRFDVLDESGGRPIMSLSSFSSNKGAQMLLYNRCTTASITITAGFDPKISLGGSGGSYDVTSGTYKVSGTQVLTSRRTGWGAPTGTATRTTFATASVTLPQLAERVKALVDDLTTHGVIGS